MQDDARLGATCESLTRDLIARLRPAMTSPREQLVTEDYIVFSLTALENRPTGQALVEQRGDDIVRLLRGEREPLSRQERDEVLRHRISYWSMTCSCRPGTPRSCRQRVARRPRPRSSSSPTRSCWSFVTTTTCSPASSRASTPICRPCLVQGMGRPPVYPRGTTGPRALHRRQRADRSGRERSASRRGYLHRASADTHRIAPRPRSVEG